MIYLRISYCLHLGFITLSVFRGKSPKCHIQQYIVYTESSLYVTSYNIIRCTNIITPRGNQRLFVLAVSVRGFRMDSSERGTRRLSDDCSDSPARISSQLTPNEFSAETIRYQPCKT